MSTETEQINACQHRTRSILSNPLHYLPHSTSVNGIRKGYLSLSCSLAAFLPTFLRCDGIVHHSFYSQRILQKTALLRWNSFTFRLCSPKYLGSFWHPRFQRFLRLVLISWNRCRCTAFATNIIDSAQIECYTSDAYLLLL